MNQKIKIKKKKKKKILDYTNNSTDKTVDFRVYVKPGFIKSLQWSEDKHIDGIEKFFKLTTTKGLSLNNIHLYDEDKIVKYTSLNLIYDTFYDKRYHLYELRKDYLCNELYKKFKLLESKIKFIKDVIDDKIVIYRKKKIEIIQSLINNNYLQKTEKTIIEMDDKEYNRDVEMNNNYDYLIKLSLLNFTEEEITKCETEYNDHKDEYDNLLKMTIEEMWETECLELLKNIKKLEKKDEKDEKDEKMIKK